MVNYLILNFLQYKAQSFSIKLFLHGIVSLLSVLFFFNPRLNKKVYTSGETASLHVDVKNNSNVDIDSFIVKVCCRESL